MPKQKNAGFIQLIIIIILSIVILSLLGVSIGSLINNKTLHENFSFLWNFLVWIWQTYAGPVWNYAKAHIPYL
jgi:hypothetical protein